MFGLIYKDMVIMKKDLMLGLLGVMFFSLPLLAAYSTDEFDAFILFVALFELACVFFIISNVQSGIYSHDESSLWQNYIKCAPKGMKRQILSKYIITLALSSFGLVWCIICNFLINIISGEKQYLSAIYVFLFISQILINSLEMPFVIYFGEKQGKVVKILMASLIGFVVLVYFLFGDLPKVNGVEEMVNYVVNLYYDADVYNVKALEKLLMVMPVALVMYYLSYVVAVRVTRYRGK